MAYNQAYFDAYHHIPAYRLRYPDENVIRFLVAHFPSETRASAKILDLGCGSGRHVILLNELGFDAYGVDGSPVAVSLTQRWIKERAFPEHVQHGYITDLPYASQMFDGIIEHATLVNNEWKDILQACVECHRVLKPGGVGFFLLKTPDDCAFRDIRPIAPHEYLIDESIYMSADAGAKLPPLLFHAFPQEGIQTMFSMFSTVRIHSWELSFKRLSWQDIPGDRRTSYWIVIVRK